MNQTCGFLFLSPPAVNFICDDPDIKAISFVGSDQAVKTHHHILSQVLYYSFVGSDQAVKDIITFCHKCYITHLLALIKP